MIARSVSRSRTPLSGSWVVMAQRASGLVTWRTASPIAMSAPDPGVLLVRGRVLELDEHPEPSPVDRRDGRAGSARASSEPSATRLVGLPARVPAGSVAADQADRSRPANADSAAAHGPTTTCPTRSGRGSVSRSGPPVRTSSSMTVPSGNRQAEARRRRGRSRRRSGRASPTMSRSTSRPVSSTR